MKNRRGLSQVIGYVLIIAISITMSIIVYAWLLPIIPTPDIKCAEGTSIFIKDAAYACTPGAETLNITVQNNGNFNVNGYYIRVSNVSDQNALAIIDISSRIKVGGNISGNSIIFNNLIYNYLTPEEPNNVRTSSFDVSGYGRLYKVEITPTRIEEYGNKKKFVGCRNAVKEALVCK